MILSNKSITFSSVYFLMFIGSISFPVKSHQTKDTPTIRFLDSVGGNEQVLNLMLPENGEPLALPNPDVFQKHSSPFKNTTTSITLQPEQQTEIKLSMSAGQMVVYAWSTDQESVYVDFHGHQPDNEEFFVRYEELDEGKTSNGSLAAPFDGHHGWFLLNMTNKPVTITIKISGFYNDIIDYGITSNSPF